MELSFVVQLVNKSERIRRLGDQHAMERVANMPFDKLAICVTEDFW